MQGRGKGLLSEGLRRGGGSAWTKDGGRKCGSEGEGSEDRREEKTGVNKGK